MNDKQAHLPNTPATKSVVGKKDSEPSLYQRNLFMSMALDMSWQLAIVVLVPLIGGVELDRHLKTTPTLTIIGSVIALGGFIAVIVNTLRQADVRSHSKTGGSR
jgi:F0F1-type ATP synthase assembly protein I